MHILQLYAAGAGYQKVAKYPFFAIITIWGKTGHRAGRKRVVFLCGTHPEIRYESDPEMFFREARLEPFLIDSRIQTDGSDLKPDESGYTHAKTIFQNVYIIYR